VLVTITALFPLVVETSALLAWHQQAAEILLCGSSSGGGGRLL